MHTYLHACKHPYIQYVNTYVTTETEKNLSLQKASTHVQIGGKMMKEGSLKGKGSWETTARNDKNQSNTHSHTNNSIRDMYISIKISTAAYEVRKQQTLSKVSALNS